MTKVIGYIRVSTEQQNGDDKFGLELQKTAIIEYCEKNDLLLINFVTDVGSGVKTDREGLQSIINPMEQREYEKVVVYKSDRISREMNLYFYVKYKLTQVGIDIVSVNEDLSIMGDFAPVMEALIMFIAEQERKNITLRTMAGKRAKKKLGGGIGGVPIFGYKYQDKEMVADYPKALYVRDIFRFHNSGYTNYRIVKMIIKKYPLARVNDTTIKRILQRERFYQGYVMLDDGVEIEGRQEAIIR